MSKHIIGQSTNINVFSDFCPSSNWERESGKRNLGVKEKCPKVTYLIFDGVPLENFLLSRANRLCSVFNTGLKDFGVLRVSVNLLSLTRSKMAMVRLPAMNPAQKLNFFLFTSAEGKGAPFPFWGPSQSFGFSLFPLPMSGDLRSLSANTWSPLRDPHSLLTVTFWLLDSADSPRENSISLTSSSPWAITWQYDKIADFFRVGTFLLLIVHTWNSSPLRSNLLQLQCTCCAVPITSGRPHGGPFVWACQWPSSQPLSSPQLSHNDSLWA